MLSRKRFCRLAQAGIEPAVLGWRLFPNRTELRRIAAGNMANPAGGLCLLSAKIG